MRSNGSYRIALHRFTVACAIATFILICVGGLVTSTGSALAVPDWPLAFGKLVPPLEGGIRFEWSHRAAAAVVGLLTLTLAIWTWWVGPRRWVRLMAWGAFGLIILQGVLGGLTVLLLLPLPLAVAHAGCAQAFFCLMVSMVLFTSPRFGSGRIKYREAVGGFSVTALAILTTCGLYLQVLIGALMRHLGAGLAIPDFPTSFGHLIPPFSSIAVDVNFAHRCGALVVTFLVIWTCARIIRLHPARGRLRSSAILTLVFLASQITLGALTIWSGRAVFPTTAHVAIGAALLGASVALTIRAYEFRPRLAAQRLSGLGSALAEAGEDKELWEQFDLAKTR